MPTRISADLGRSQPRDGAARDVGGEERGAAHILIRDAGAKLDGAPVRNRWCDEAPAPGAAPSAGVARFCSEAQRERPIERARRRSTSLSPTPGGRRGSQRRWRGVAASVATTSSSRNGYRAYLAHAMSPSRDALHAHPSSHECRASRPWSLTTRSSRPKLRFHSRARSAASSAPKPAQPPRLKAVR